MNNNKDIKIEETHESPLVMLFPLFVLSIGAVFAGFLFKGLFIGHSADNFFWAQSIKFLEPLSTRMKYVLRYVVDLLRLGGSCQK